MIYINFSLWFDRLREHNVSLNPIVRIYSKSSSDMVKDFIKLVF